MTGFRELDRRHPDAERLVGEQVARQRLLQLRHGAEVAGLDLRHRGLGLALQQHQVAEPLRRVAGRRCAPSSPTLSVPEMTRNMRDASGERIGDGLPDERRQRRRVRRLERRGLLAARHRRRRSPAPPATARRRRCASSSGCMPMFAVADAQSTGKMRPAAMPRLRPATSSSCVSVPASKNFSISASSASATISISASRALLAAPSISAGTGAFGGLAAAVGGIGPRLHARPDRRCRGSSSLRRSAAESG